MSTDYQGNGREGETQQFGSAAAVKEDTHTETLVSSAVGDRCVNCGATLLSDQRYCVVCGERRGAPRFALPAAQAATEVTSTSSISGRGGAKGPRWGSPTTLVAGVGTLLLALLVGFLIGNAATKNNNTKPVASAPPVIKVVNTGGGGSAGTSTAANTATTSGSGSGTSSGSSKSKSKASKSAPSKKTTNAESSAASKVTGGTNAPPASTKVGQKCSGSACDKSGYNKKTHKFDGSFFGQ
jgi:hypothetical protein